MAITINGSGTITGISAGGLPDGSVTAADIESSLDLSGKTVTLPSGVGGKVLQVVEGIQASNASTTSAGTHTDSGLSVSITPSSTSSKILVFSQSRVRIDSSNQIMRGGVRMLRDSTPIVDGSDENVQDRNYPAEFSHTIGMQILDSPSTTSSVTYKVQFFFHSSMTSTTMYHFNYSAGSRMVALEIAG